MSKSVALLLVFAFLTVTLLLISPQIQIVQMQARRNDLQNQIDQIQEQVSNIQAQNSDYHELLENQTKIVKVTDFYFNTNEARYERPTSVGLQITIKNLGIGDVNNITIIVKMLYNDDEVDSDTLTLDILHTEEEQSLSASLYTSSYRGREVYIVLLKTGDLVLDERTL